MALADEKIYLASKSPRRRELLRQIGVEFEMLMFSDLGGKDGAVSETPHENEVPEEYVSRIARAKAEQGWNAVFARKLLPRPVLAADTTVTIDGLILGKPANTEDAIATLKLLSGRTHLVLTSVAVIVNDKLLTILQQSEVTFTNIPEDIMRTYCALPEPYDKAGSYVSTRLCRAIY